VTGGVRAANGAHGATAPTLHRTGPIEDHAAFAAGVPSAAAAAVAVCPVNTSTADAAESAARELHDIERRLTAPDAVLENDIFSVATSYLKLRRRQIKEVIQMLSDNFVGYPAMASLVCEWLAMLAAEPDPHEASQGANRLFIPVRFVN
jgi:hypothetical protein